MAAKKVQRVIKALRPFLLLVALLSPLLSGCVSQSVPVNPAKITASPQAESRVVVAFVDTGVNFFHDAFRFDTQPPDFVAATTLDVPRHESLDQDLKDFPWASVEPRHLYWLRGTRILTLTFGETLDPREVVTPQVHHPLLDDYDHGTGVAGLIHRATPEGWLVSVEASEENQSEALRWVSEQPWIDVVSVSLGTTANLYLPNTPSFAEPTFKTVQRGALVVFGAGNDPTVTTFDDDDGPPWVICVGGARNSTKGLVIESSLPVDVASNYVDRAPRFNQTTGNDIDSGTSFAAPIVAGTLAQVILDLRKHSEYTGGIQNGLLVSSLGIGAAQVRAAMNATAIYWNTTEYDAAAGIEPYPFATAFWASVPMLPAAGPAGPWMQFGWGYVNETLAPPMVALLLGRSSPPAKPAEATSFMEAVQQAREARWPPPA